MTTKFFIYAWVDQRYPQRGTRQVGHVTTSKQAAIRQAERLLPAGAEFIITTLNRTVHEGITSGARSKPTGSS